MNLINKINRCEVLLWKEKWNEFVLERKEKNNNNVAKAKMLCDQKHYQKNYLGSALLVCVCVCVTQNETIDTFSMLGIFEYFLLVCSNSVFKAIDECLL